MEQLKHYPPGSEQFISHPALARPGIHPFPDRLWIVTVLENPLRYRSRYDNYHAFAHSVDALGGKLITVELATGKRSFELTEPGNPCHLQLRTRDEMFHKENLQNLGAHLLPLGTEYVAFIDADMLCTRPDWFQETLHQLQHYDAVQMFSTYTDLDARQIPYRTMPSFMFNYLEHPERSWPSRNSKRWLAGYDYGAQGRPPAGSPGATGGAWAYRVEALSTLGGLMDRCILGSADWYMAFGLVQKQDVDERSPLRTIGPEVTTRVTDSYKSYIESWIANAAKLHRNVGYVEAHLIHRWHGPKEKRQYGTRWQILENSRYDPYVDIRANHQGVWEWSGNKPTLRDAVRKYLRDRREDSTEHARNLRHVESF